MTQEVNYLASNPLALALACLVLGLIVGSFLNVVIYRLPRMLESSWKAQCRDICELPAPDQPEPVLTLSTPASTCPHCGHRIRAWENIPVVSYLFLRGRCSNCKATISPRYPLIELASGLLCAWAAIHFGWSWQLAGALLLTWALISLTMIDIDTQLLPDNITLPLLWLGLLANVNGWFVPLQDAVIGAAAGYLSLWSVYHAFRLLTGKEGMGFGDFKLLGALGAWMGWQMLPLVILLSSLVGAVIGIAMIAIRGQDRNIPIPFGPYLAIAGWIAFYWGDAIVALYLGSLFSHA